jgi:hypothetical protein
VRIQNRAHHHVVKYTADLSISVLTEPRPLKSDVKIHILVIVKSEAGGKQPKGERQAIDMHRWIVLLRAHCAVQPNTGLKSLLTGLETSSLAT